MLLEFYIQKIMEADLQQKKTSDQTSILRHQVKLLKALDLFLRGAFECCSVSLLQNSQDVGARETLVWNQSRI